MNDLHPNYQIRSARIEDLATLAEIEQDAATLFCDTPYAFLIDDESLSQKEAVGLEALSLQSREESPHERF